jgi:hypothetical protein
VYELALHRTATMLSTAAGIGGALHSVLVPLTYGLNNTYHRSTFVRSWNSLRGCCCPGCCGTPTGSMVVQRTDNLNRGDPARPRHECNADNNKNNKHGDKQTTLNHHLHRHQTTNSIGFTVHRPDDGTDDPWSRRSQRTTLTLEWPGTVAGSTQTCTGAGTGTCTDGETEAASSPHMLTREDRAAPATESPRPESNNLPRVMVVVDVAGSVGSGAKSPSLVLDSPSSLVRTPRRGGMASRKWIPAPRATLTTDSPSTQILSCGPITHVAGKPRAPGSARMTLPHHRRVAPLPGVLRAAEILSPRSLPASSSEEIGETHPRRHVRRPAAQFDLETVPLARGAN